MDYQTDMKLFGMEYEKTACPRCKGAARAFARTFHCPLCDLAVGRGAAKWRAARRLQERFGRQHLGERLLRLAGLSVWSHDPVRMKTDGKVWMQAEGEEELWEAMGGRPPEKLTGQGRRFEGRVFAAPLSTVPGEVVGMRVMAEDGRERALAWERGGKPLTFARVGTGKGRLYGDLRGEWKRGCRALLLDPLSTVAFALSPAAEEKGEKQESHKHPAKAL